MANQIEDSGVTHTAHASQISSSRRAVAYLAILSGYFFYCYSFLVPGYVRPWLIEDYHFTLSQTASISVAQNIGITFGSMILATVIAKLGRRRAAAAIIIVIGLLTIANATLQEPYAWLAMRGIIAMFLGGYYVAAVSLMVALFPLRYRAKLLAFNSAMFAGAEIALGALAFSFGEANWIWLLLFGGIPPLLLGLAILLCVPDDRSFVGYGEEDKSQDSNVKKVGDKSGWSEMFSKRYRRITITCLLLGGSNFTGYQLFTEFVTLYLKQVRQFDGQEIGIAFSLIGLGSLTGGLFWATLADKYGRKIPLAGFVGVALFISLFLSVPHQPVLIKALGFGYGFCLACTYHWGVWFTELFPVRLRPYGASLFPAGHFLALFAPLVVSIVSTRFGITAGMALAPAVFLCGLFLGLTLPETLQTSRYYRGRPDIDGPVQI